MFKFDLLENEKSLGTFRQSEAVLFRPVIIIFFLIYFPWYFLLKYDLAANYNRLLLFWTFLVFIYGLHQFFLWLLNAYLVTNRRLIMIAHKNVLNKKVLESPLDRILNISFTRKGFWQSLFGLGNVEVQIAGLNEPLILKNVSHPGQLKDFLWKVHTHYGQGSMPKAVQQETLIHRPKIVN